VHGNSDRNRYIQTLRLNGRPYRLPYLEYADIVAGGTLDIEMGREPVLWYDN
jgi:putative alpha-1,2-mannosidase